MPAKIMTKRILVAALSLASFIPASAQITPTAELSQDAYERLQIFSARSMLRGYCYVSPASAGEHAAGTASGGVRLIAEPDARVAFRERHRGLRLRLVNATDTVAHFEASDGRLYIVQEAVDTDGEWRFIEYLPSSWCGNSYHTLALESGQAWAFAAPRYSGTHPTRLRFRLIVRDRSGERSIYSNEFDGSVNPGQFTELEEFSPGGVMDPYDGVRSSRGRYGLIDREGRVVVEPIYDEIRAARAALGIKRNGKWGAIDFAGREVIPPTYDNLYDAGDRFLAVNRGARLHWNGEISGGLWGLADSSGREVVEPRYDRLEPLACGLTIVYRDRAFGVIDASGREVVPLRFASVQSRHDLGADGSEEHDRNHAPYCPRLFVVERDSLYGIMSADGRELLPTVAREVRWLTRDLLAVQVNGAWSLVHANGARRELPGIAGVGGLSGGLIAASQRGRWGFIDTTGRFVVAAVYDDLRAYSGGILGVGVGAVPHSRRYGIVDTSGRVVVPIEYDDVRLDEGSIRVMRNDRNALFDRAGTALTPFYDRISNIEQGVAFFREKGTGTGLVDHRGRIILQPRYESIMIYPHGIVVDSGHGRALFTHDGRRLTEYLPYRFDPTFGERHAALNGWVVAADDRYGWMDTTGALTIAPEWISMQQSVTEERIIVIDGERFGVIATDGRVIVPPTYRSIEPYRRGVAIVVDGGGDQ
jgi:hypothetical protein